jgi:hypothetical protein
VNFSPTSSSWRFCVSPSYLFIINLIYFLCANKKVYKIFPKNQPISYKDYMKWAVSWMDDISEIGYAEANWDLEVNGIDTFEQRGLSEIKVNKPGTFLPIVQPRTDEEAEEDDYEIIYDNLIANIKRFKDKIAKHLNITDKDLLNQILAYYVNGYGEVEHYGGERDYKDITLEEFLEDIALVYEYSEPADLEPDPNYDTITIQDIQEIKVNKPNPLNFLLSLKSKINVSNIPKENLSLAIKCAEMVLFIWEEKYPNNKRPRQAIEAAKACLVNPTEKNKKELNNSIKKTKVRSFKGAGWYTTNEVSLIPLVGAEVGYPKWRTISRVPFH